MAKLSKENAKKVADADSGGFDPIDDGTYHVKLRDVDSSRSGPAGPYWSWEFEVVEEGPAHNRRLWNNTSLSEAAHFKLKESFEAFGAETDADTDDLLGQVCRAVVSTRTIQQGPRKGEQANQIDRLLPAAEDFEAPVNTATEAETEDIFS